MFNKFKQIASIDLIKPTELLEQKQRLNKPFP